MAKKSKSVTKKIKVLMYCDAPSSATGFSTVSRNICESLYKTGRYEIDVFGINYWGDPHSFPWRQWPAGTNQDRDPYGRKKFFNMAPQMEFDILFLLQDTFILEFVPQLISHLKSEGKTFKSICYFPVDGTPKEQWIKNVNPVDYLIAYTQFGATQAKLAYPDVQDMRIIPHGANVSDYRPVPKDEVDKFKAMYFGKHADKFIVTNVNRNQQRKDIPRTISAFKEFRKSVPNSVLYLHMASKDQGWDLEKVVASCGLNTMDDVIFPENFGPNQGYPREVVNLIYNSSDLVVSTTVGEGWGLCLHGSTNVMTTNGSTKIGDVSEGDKVILGGKTYDVRGVCNSLKERSYKIKLYNNQELIVSPEHRIPVGTGGYKNASDITINDKLIIDKAVLYSDTDYTYDMSIFSNESDDKQVWNKMGFSPKNENSMTTIMVHTGETKKIVETAIKVFLDEKNSNSERVNSVVEYLDTIDYSRPLVKINRYVDFTPEFARLLGYYVAEGSNENGKGIEFSFHRTEESYHADVKYLMNKYFGVDSIDKFIDNKCAIRYRSSILSMFFGGLCGVHSHNKHIPLLCLQHRDKASEFIKGCWRGDGHFGNIELGYSTSSVKLKEELMWLLSGFNIFSKAIRDVRDNYNIYVNGEDYNILSNLIGHNNVHNTYKERKYLRKEDECFILDIKSIEKYDCADDMFYDLSIDSKEHFVANGIVVHNSWVEAMATKTPVLMPNNTAMTEHITEDKGYLSDSGNSPSLYTVLPHDNEVIRPLVDVADMAKKMVHIHDHYDEAMEKANRAYIWVKTELNWQNKIARDWVDLFDNAYDELNTKHVTVDAEVDKLIKSESF